MDILEQSSPKQQKERNYWWAGLFHALTAHSPRTTGVEQHSLRGSSLSGINVRHNPHISDGFLGSRISTSTFHSLVYTANKNGTNNSAYNFLLPKSWRYQEPRTCTLFYHCFWLINQQLQKSVIGVDLYDSVSRETLVRYHVGPSLATPIFVFTRACCSRQHGLARLVFM